jgi:hypothetical protein
MEEETTVDSHGFFVSDGEQVRRLRDSQSRHASSEQDATGQIGGNGVIGNKALGAIHSAQRHQRAA